MINGIATYKDTSKGNFSFENWNSLRDLSEEEKIKEICIFKDLKNLNAQIRKFRKEQDEDKTFYWVLEVGMVESLGEQGYNYIFFYNEFPLISEIEEDIINHIIDHKKELSNNNLLSAYEENHLKALEKIKL